MTATANKLKGISGAFSLSAINQGISSGTSFVFAVYLVKVLSPADYGIYGLSMAASYCIGGIGTSLFLTQMVVNTPQRSEPERPLFAASTLVNVVLFSVVLALLSTLVFVTCAAIDNRLVQYIDDCVASSAVTATFLIKEFFIRHAYNTMNERWTVYIHSILAAVLALIMTALRWYGFTTSVVTALWAFSLAHACAVLFGVVLAKLPLAEVTAKVLYREAALSWSGGRWTAVSSIVYFLRTQAHTIVAAALIGPVGVAKLNATRLFVTPPVMLIPALGQVFLPRLAHLAAVEPDKIQRTTNIFAALLLGISIVYSVAMLSSLDYIEKNVLAGKYSSIALLMASWCVYICIFSVRSSTDIAVQVLKRFREQMNAYIVSAIVTLAVTVLLVTLVHQDSYVFGMIIGEVAVFYLLSRAAATTCRHAGNSYAGNPLGADKP